MSVVRPRFKPPIALEKVRREPLPPSMTEVLESLTVALPTDVPTREVMGDPVGKRGDTVIAKPTLRAPTSTKLPPQSEEIPGVAMEKPTATKPKPEIVVPATEAPLPPALAALETRVRKVAERNPVLVKETAFVPQNRRAFKQFIIQSFKRYYLKPPAAPDPDACAKALQESKKEVKTFNYQAFVRDYLQRPSPYRGVLVYHGLGSGKTCTSIAAMEALYNANQRPIYIFTPASLSKNYRDEITKCGPFIFRTNNHWTFLPVTSFKANPAEAQFLMNVIGLPPNLIRAQKGGWVPDPAKPANFESLKAEQQRQIQKQIYDHIELRFQFIHYNGLLEKTVRDWACKDPFKFDGATIVIDEVHNLIRTINNSNMESFFKAEPRDQAQYSPKFCDVGRKYRISYLLYRMLCSAVGTKIIALSGTPLINYPQEIAILANILAGDTRMVEATVEGLANKDSLQTKFAAHPEVDFAEVIPRPNINASLVRLTPLPSGCRKVVDESTGKLRGFVRDLELMPDSVEHTRERRLEEWFARVAKDTGGELKGPKFIAVSRLPDLEKPFRELFVDTERLEIKERTKLPLMARLSGLISYYKGGRADLMAEVTKDVVVELEMSDLQLKEYTGTRKEEIDKELKQQKKKPQAAAAPKRPNMYEEITKGQSSTFKVFSRAACNFAFPADMDRPKPKDFRDFDRMLGIADEDAEGTEITDEEKEDRESMLDTTERPGAGKTTAYEAAKQDALRELRAKGNEVFSKENLPIYSPKYQAILDNMEEADGPVLVYSQFKSMEGISLFAMAMEVQKGFKKFGIQAAPGGGWTLTEETKSAGPGTPRYIAYTGDEDAEQRNILKAVFNGAWSKMPGALAEEIKALTGTTHNKDGEIARVFMITQSGAEGISLSNVRQVHIMEPYWNYVRLDQVKGRAIRICSHMDLPPEKRKVAVFTYISKFSERQRKERLVDETLINMDNGQTTDQSILAISNAKKKLADQLFEVMQGSAVDCEINANENGALACYRFQGVPSMDYLFHPLVTVHLEEDEAAVRRR